MQSPTPTAALAVPEVLTATLATAEAHPAAVYLSSLGKTTQRTMLGDLNVIARLLSSGSRDAQGLDWTQVRYEHTAMVRATLAERYPHNTVNRMLCALRGVLKACRRLGYITSDDYTMATDVAPVRGHTLPSGRALSAGEIRALFVSCAEGDSIGTRDAALLAVLYGCGLRRAEAVKLNVSDYDSDTGALKVFGKGNKERLVYASAGTKHALAKWLDLRGTIDGPLFIPVLRGGNMTTRRLTAQTVYDILTKRVKSAGIKAASPHDLRRSNISDLLDAGVDIVTVQHLAGHASVTTTGRYDRRGEDVKKKAAGLLHVPVVE